MKIYHKIEVGGELVYLRKSFLGWSIIHPIKINNKINWKNLITGGHWLKPIIIISIVLIILGCIYEYSSIVNLYQECLNKQIIWQS